MSQYKYKNVSGRSQALIGFGVFEADEELLTNRAVENPNFQFLGNDEQPQEPEAQTPSINPSLEEEQPEPQPDNQENQ